ncbi:MAG: hypothetical protein WBD20_03485 [Pirellulaceae bacterium]
MTDHEQNEFPELSRAITAINSQSFTDGPTSDLVTSTVEALQANDKSVASTLKQPVNRREKMIRLAKYGTLGTAASIALVVVGSMLLSGLPGQNAFAQVIQNVREATGAKYTVTQKLGKQPAMTSESCFSDGIIRTEVAGHIIVFANAQTGETLQLIPAQKLAIPGKSGEKALAQPLSVADVMKEMTEDHGELIETITEDDGTKLDVYRVSQLPSFMGNGKVSGKDGFKVWVDSATKLPTRIKVDMTMGPANSVVELEFSDFQWNPTFPPGHFDMTVPDGYKVKEGLEITPAK